MSLIRISHTRTRYAAELLAGSRSNLLTLTDHLEMDRETAQRRRQRRGDQTAVPAHEDAARLIAAALFIEWIIDTLRRQTATYFELDRALARSFDTGAPAPEPEPEMPPLDTPAPIPPEWRQPPLPTPHR